MPRKLAAAALSVLLCACGGEVPQLGPDSSTGSTAAPARSFQPIDKQHVLFWDRQTTETRELLQQIVQDFNATGPALSVLAEYTGNYSDIFRKITASIEAGKLPALAVSYESMTAEYIKAGAVAPLDDFVNDPEVGYTPEDLQDFFPVVMDINRYEQFGGKMYSFPFTKSVLMLYFNENVLKNAGIDGPPQTWDEFLDQCRKVKAKTGAPAYALNVDASTIDGMIYSMGGKVVDGNKTLFDSPESIRVFELLGTLAKEQLCYQITPRTYDDETALAQGKVAFITRSSSGRTSILELMGGKTEGWGIARIPQADPQDPATVLYGPNVCIFNVPMDQRKVAWRFIKHFTSPDVSARWALGSGYVPIRKSAADHPDVQAFWAKWKYNRAAYDCLPIAKSEPNLVGWQKVRQLIEDAETAVLTGLQSAPEAARELKRKADAALAQASK